MENFFIFSLVALTSFFAYQLGKKKRKEGMSEIRAAVNTLFEWIGVFSILYFANLTAGVIVVLIVRTFTPGFLTVYSLENVLLLILSAAQAFVFHRWWKRER